MCAFSVLDILIGNVNILSGEITNAMADTILTSIRIPKTLTCIFAGSALAVSGLLMQSLFRNPLAGPYVLGISSGSSFMVAIATMLLTSISVSGFAFMGKSFITLFSIIGALGVTTLILIISKKNKSNITVLLVGLMLAQILGALQSLIEFLSNAESLKTFVIWGMGSVGSTTMSDLFFVIPLVSLTIFISFFMVKGLNAILLNETYAQNLGINTSQLRIGVILITSVLVGITTAYCGPIAFIGISVPIASRLLFKTSNHFHQLLFCSLLGGTMLVFSDLMCQVVSSQIMLPINTVTTIIGSPVVLYLLFKSKLQVT